MKKTIKIMILVMAAAFATASVSARTIEIKMSQCPEPLVENVRSMVSQASVNDVVVLNFDKPGTYEFDGTIKIRSNTIIKGVDSKKTRVIVKEGFAGGKSKMLDDTFFAIHGYSNKKVKVEVRDIRFELASHKGILWETAPKHIFKICDGDGITVDNATFWSTDAVITHIDLRDCSNVLVQNCTFENYNNCREGGELWSRGEQENLVIRNNVFWKYGNDEAFGIWGGNHKRVVFMRNILVENNEFNYENKTKCKKNIPIDVLIAFCHFETNDTKYDCNVDNIVFTNNKITMNAVSNCDMKLTFDKLAKIGNFEISHNTIINTAKCSSSSSYMKDFEIKTDVLNETPILLKNNEVRSDCEVLCDGKNSGYTFLGIKGANIQLTDNYISSKYGLALLWCHGGDNDVKLENNTVEKLYKIAILNDMTHIGTFKITATNNEFGGETSIYSNNIDRLIIDFRNNVFNVTNYHFLMIEGAQDNTLNFENNIINSYNRNGAMYANYSGKRNNFDKVNIKNNIFNGISKSSVEGVFKTGKKSIAGNVYK